MPIQTIEDPRIKVRSTKAILHLIKQHKEMLFSVPPNIAKLLETNGCNLPADVISPKMDLTPIRRKKIDVSLIETLDDITGEDVNKTLPTNPASAAIAKSDCYLFLTDLHWLNDFLKQLRKEKKSELFLHELLQRCELVLPQNEITPRNPVLEERCEKLRNEQFNRKYMQMTKGVDPVHRKRPEDSFAYQIKAVNKQIAVVMQVLFSIVAGFVFGFWGLSYLNGGLEFGVRLLIGIGCATVIAIAELYILIKKLCEYDEDVDSANSKVLPSSIYLKSTKKNNIPTNNKDDIKKKN